MKRYADSTSTHDRNLVFSHKASTHAYQVKVLLRRMNTPVAEALAKLAGALGAQIEALEAGRDV